MPHILAEATVTNEHTTLHGAYQDGLYSDDVVVRELGHKSSPRTPEVTVTDCSSLRCLNISEAVNDLLHPEGQASHSSQVHLNMLVGCRMLQVRLQSFAIMYRVG